MKAIIVGASSGIGLEIAKQLLAEGWYLGIAARREEALLALKETTPDRIEVMTIDITHSDASERLLSLIERLGGMDLYFHSSGIGKQNRTLEPDIELQTMQTNAVGFTRMIGTACRYFAERGKGHIAAITSIYCRYQGPRTCPSLCRYESTTGHLSTGIRATGSSTRT